MYTPVRLFKKTIALLIAIFMISLIVVAFDNHVITASSTCPICKAKFSLNGTQNSITVEFDPAVTYHYTVEQSPGVIIPISLSFENRAPPTVYCS